MNCKCCFYNDDKKIMVNMNRKEVNYNVEFNDRRVTCTIYDKYTNKEYKGIAKCLPNDIIDVNIGKDISYKKAMNKKIKYDINHKKQKIEFYKNKIQKLNEIIKKENKSIEKMSTTLEENKKIINNY